MKGRFAIALLFALVAIQMASAGVLRNVVKPVVKTSAKVTAKVVVGTAKVVKTIAY